MYMCTPVGPALAQITEQHLLKGRAVSTLVTHICYLHDAPEARPNPAQDCLLQPLF